MQLFNIKYCYYLISCSTTHLPNFIIIFYFKINNLVVHTVYHYPRTCFYVDNIMEFIYFIITSKNIRLIKTLIIISISIYD